METIAIVNQKGGSTKTTLAVNLAYGLAKAGKRVVLLDLDPQGGASAWSGHNQELTELDYGTPLMECLIKGKPKLGELFEASGHGYFVVPNSVEFVPFDANARNELAHEQLLRKAIATLPASELDYVLVDTPPHIGPSMTMALTAANYYLLAIQAQAPNLEPAERAFKLATRIEETLNPGLECGVVLGDADMHLLQTRDMYSALQEDYGDRLYTQVIRHTTRFGEAFSRETPIQKYDGRGIGAKDFNALTEEFLKRREAVQPSSRKRRSATDGR